MIRAFSLPAPPTDGPWPGDIAGQIRAGRGEAGRQVVSSVQRMEAARGSHYAKSLPPPPPAKGVGGFAATPAEAHGRGVGGIAATPSQVKGKGTGNGTDKGKEAAGGEEVLRRPREQAARRRGKPGKDRGEGRRRPRGRRQPPGRPGRE